MFGRGGRQRGEQHPADWFGADRRIRLADHHHVGLDRAGHAEVLPVALRRAIETRRKRAAVQLRDPGGAALVRSHPVVRVDRQRLGWTRRDTRKQPLHVRVAAGSGVARLRRHEGLPVDPAGGGETGYCVRAGCAARSSAPRCGRRPSGRCRRTRSRRRGRRGSGPEGAPDCAEARPSGAGCFSIRRSYLASSKCPNSGS